MAPSPSSSASLHHLTWRPTKIMHMRDLSKDDDFLSHLLVEKLGTGTVPLLVHKMDSSRRLPKTDSQVLMRIVRRLVATKGPVLQAVRTAVDELLTLPPIRYYLKSYTQKQINAFATHASRYFELYHPSGSIEIAHTSRYSHRTGKSELCILATRNLQPGTVITELKGSMANLTDEEDKELKRTDLRNSDIRRDFSVIHSKSMKKNHLFLGPARFVNHDCENNCELFREGRYITFRVLRHIAIGEEITAHYGDGYFGKKNRHCLCETCEKKKRGGYAPEHQQEEAVSSSDSSSDSDADSDSDSDTSSSSSESDASERSALNLHERRTRRGVYAITKPDDDGTDDSDNEEDEDDDKVPLAGAKDVPADSEIELTAEIDTGSGLTSLAASMPPSDGATLPEKQTTRSSMTPLCNVGSRSSSSLTDLTSSPDRSSTPKSTKSTPFRSIISTRRQKAKESSPRSGGGGGGGSTETSPKRLTRSTLSLALSAKKTKGKATSTPSTPRTTRASAKDDTKIKKEDIEPRVLRTRSSLAAPEAAKVQLPKKKEVPRGADGKPLPTCSTCSNVLPLIAVDHKVVWGDKLEGGKKKKNMKHDCPRCIRHFAIYQLPWPVRVAARGTISVTPAEDPATTDAITKKVTHKGLHVLDRKLAAAASASSSSKQDKSKKRRREEASGDKDRPPKRRKSEPEPVIRSTKVIQTYSSRKKQISTGKVEEPLKRKRGRPRLSSPRRVVVKTKVKVEDPPPEVEKSILSQPRSVNGRFGRKDKMAKRGMGSPSQASSSHTGHSGTEHDSDSDDHDSNSKAKWVSPRRKRSNDAVMEEAEQSPRKRVTHSTVEREPELLAPAQRVLPRPMSGFRGGKLFSKPNPLQYALYAWAGPVVLDDISSSDDDKHPETPEDDHISDVSVVAPEEEEPPLFLPPPPLRAPLTYKPTPWVLAKSRWNNAASLGSLANGQKISSTNPRIYSFAEETSDTSAPKKEEPRPLSSLSEDYVSPRSFDDNLPPPKLRHIYPVLPPPTASNAYIPKSSTFPSLNPTKPNFINAGWDDSSDVSEI